MTDKKQSAMAAGQKSSTGTMEAKSISNFDSRTKPSYEVNLKYPITADNGNGLDAAGDAEPKASSFADQVYSQINAVIGGSNPNQFLCLTIPGQALTAEDFTYDYKNNAPKGPAVEANESRLVNKMFDPCCMTGADNGLTLPYQYRTALDMLTPKLNLKVAEAKNQLRQLLMTNYPYDFGDGEKKDYTLQEVFFRLYDEWIAESEKWSTLQNQKKEELRRKYPASDAKNNLQYNDAYLEWYETVAESHLNAINEKMSRVISVFTPNDMKILEGILDSGSGAELQEARQTLLNTQKLTPDGGYVYPVKMNPTNWFELLKTSFTPIDLLKTPDVLSQQLKTYSIRRLNLSAKISDISKMIPDKKTIEALQASVDQAKAELDKAKTSLIAAYGQGISAVLDTVFDIAPLFTGGAVPANIISKLASGLELPGGKDSKELIKSLTDSLATTSNAQQEYVNASQKLADASQKAIEAQNLANLSTIIDPLKAQLDEINYQIADIQAQIQLSATTYPKPDPETGKVKDEDMIEDSVVPPGVPEGYTQIVISASASSLDKGTSQAASSSVSTSGSSFWFFGHSSTSKSSSSSFSSFTNQADTSIQIGMNIAKVGIEREWFNPGIFVLTKDMFKVTTMKIAPNPRTPYTNITDERLRAMSDDCIFSSYPVAMLIARDISIKLTSATSISSEFSESVEKHASSGGGFLFFSGSSSSSSSSSKSGVHAVSADNTVTLKFDTPQIIGYYLEATSADKSVYLDDTAQETEAGYVSITKFVDEYKKILEEMQNKKNEER